MKKFTSKYIIQTLLIYLFSTQICFAQWTLQNPLSSGRPLNDVCFVDANFGVAVGDSGTILRTTDGGKKWIAQSGFEKYILTAVHFTDVNNGTVVGFEIDSSSLIGIILRTKDGGNNWTTKKIEVSSGFTDVYFSDANNGTIVGGPVLAGFGTILRTIDGGENWSVQLCDSIENWALKGVYFTDADNGIVVGRRWNPNKKESVILKTNDGGKNWVEQNTEIIESLNKVRFVNDSVGWIAGGAGYVDNSGIILKTTDGGNSWIQQTTNISANGFFDVCFTDFNNGIVVGSSWETDYSSIILRTFDGGINWIQQYIGINGHLNGVSFSDANHGIIVGSSLDYPQYGIILRNSNGGVTFVEEQALNETPSGFLLSQNYPNPFNSDTKMKYSVTKPSNVILKVFDIHGKAIDILVNEVKPAGTFEVTWHAGNLPGGVYFYQLNAGGLIETRKMILRR